MRPISVVPARASPQVEHLLAACGWRAGRAPSGWADDARAAVGLAGKGRPVLFVPEPASISRALQRIVVVHAGHRAERAGVDAADAAAIATGAEIVVLHVASATPPTGSASLPFRLGDHPAHDWPEWREEFLRRFCRCSEGVSVSLRLATGPVVDSVRLQALDVQAGLLIVTRDGGSDPKRTRTLETLLVASPCPVLIVPGTGKTNNAAGHTHAAGA